MCKFIVNSSFIFVLLEKEPFSVYNIFICNCKSNRGSNRIKIKGTQFYETDFK